VYLRSGICDDKMLFVLFGANGVPAGAAVETAIELGLSFVAVR
jgi:hypothetical protein